MAPCSFGVAAKDLILALIGTIGTAGGTGHVIEYAGSAIRGLTMEGRMTVSNMSIEAGARAGLIAPDDVTFDYLRGRPQAPPAEAWEQAVAGWRTLPSDPAAAYDARWRSTQPASRRRSPGAPARRMSSPSAARCPTRRTRPTKRRAAMARSLAYMGLAPGMQTTDIRIDKVFIGSCTNSRIEDLRAAAAIVRGRRKAGHVEALVVPGSGLVKRQAEQEGLDRIFRDAGFEWREAGCSMCLAMNDDRLKPGERCASTSNRNFEGRQGYGGRTHLMSPAMAAAAAVTGRLADVRELMR